jgi:hypothetical protein
MKQFLLFSISVILVSSCVYENEEDAYYSTPNNHSNSLDSGLLAHFCFQNSLVDSSKNNVSGTFNGTPVYGDFSLGNRAIVLNGTDNYFEIPVGNHDTIAISMFFKGEAALSTPQNPYLLDYGQGALSLDLDAVSGGTYIVVNGNKLNDDPDNSWICSFSKWNHLYLEAILSKKQVKVLSTTFGDNSGLIEIRSLQPNIAAPMTLKNGSILIGYNSSNSSNENYFKGLIDDIRIYNRKLSNTELHQISKVLQ